MHHHTTGPARAHRPDNNVTLRDANWIFVLSRMRVVDEMGGKKAQLKLENLSLEDCFEALVRFACTKALPTVRANGFRELRLAPAALLPYTCTHTYPRTPTVRA